MAYDVIILGAGPGGIAAARKLSAGGKSVALVENSAWGGTCLNCGCIPTKMLLGATAPGALLHGHTRLRVLRGSITVDYQALQARVQRFVKGSSQSVGKELAAAGVTLLQGQGTCMGPGEVCITAADGTQETVRAADIILACGSRSASFPGLEPDGNAILDSTGVLSLPEVPESLLIVGAGAIGLEMADFFAALGTQVTLVEAAPHIAPTEDVDIAAEMAKACAKTGKTCLAGVKARSLVTDNGMALLTLEDGTELRATKALVAVGRLPNTENLACESMGCHLNKRGFIETNAFLEAAQHVYAIGDVNGRVLLAHAAEHQAAYVAERLLGRTNREYLSGPVPSCIYGSTEIMRVGASVQDLVRAGQTDIYVSQVALACNAIAQASGNSAGFVKVVWAGEEIAGIAAVGHGVSHLVTAAQLLIAFHVRPENLHAIMFAHPTLDEVLPAAIRAPRRKVLQS